VKFRWGKSVSPKKNKILRKGGKTPESQTGRSREIKSSLKEGKVCANQKSGAQPEVRVRRARLEKNSLLRKEEARKEVDSSQNGQEGKTQSENSQESSIS